MSEPEAYNAANPDHVHEARELAKDAREKELNDVAFILASKQGRRFFARYLNICGIHKISYTGNNGTFFAEGERNIGLKMISDMNEAAPELYIEMLKDELETKKLKSNKRGNK